MEDAGCYGPGQGVGPPEGTLGPWRGDGGGVGITLVDADQNPQEEGLEGQRPALDK